MLSSVCIDEDEDLPSDRNFISPVHNNDNNILKAGVV